MIERDKATLTKVFKSLVTDMLLADELTLNTDEVGCTSIISIGMPSVLAAICIACRTKQSVSLKYQPSIIISSRWQQTAADLGVDTLTHFYTTMYYYDTSIAFIYHHVYEIFRPAE